MVPQPDHPSPGGVDSETGVTRKRGSAFNGPIPLFIVQSLLLLLRKKLRDLLQHVRDIEFHEKAVSSALLRFLPVLFAAQ